MERMETRLFEAAAEGSISSLQNLLEEDPLILDRVVVNCFFETPLHVAAMLGHTDFVKEIIKKKPQLISELNSRQSSPLHLASAKGHVDVATALSSADPRACLARDKNGCTPLHLAALKGQIEVMKVLLQDIHDAAQLTVYKGENILHLCVKLYRLEALKLLVSKIGDPEIINSKDADGNTVLHVAVACKQVEVIDFLLTVLALDVNAQNLNGKTAMDILVQSRRDIRDADIEESLRGAGGFGILEGNSMVGGNQNTGNRASSPRPGCDSSSNKRQKNIPKNIVKHHGDWLEKKRNALMVVASLIATMAFQVGVNPPGAVWQDDKNVDLVSDHHEAGSSIMAQRYPNRYEMFYVLDTVSFIASLSIILLLMSGLPLRRRVFMWILMVITWVAISAIALVYVVSIACLAPHQHSVDFIKLGVTIVSWIVVMSLLLISHTVRLIVMLVKKLRKILTRNRRTVADSAGGDV